MTLINNQQTGNKGFCPPSPQCDLCPRLVEFRHANAQSFPHYHNGAVSSFGDLDAAYLFVGLAPGLHGANRTNRPFTGDYAGDLLYPTLKSLGLAMGEYQARPDDGFQLVNVRITNAVRCVPPQNKPNAAEFNQCRPFLVQEMAAMPNLKGIFAIGRDGHDAVMGCLSLKKSAYPFAHGRVHQLAGGLVLVDSYHCSRYNTNTGRLTPEMFSQAVCNLLAATRALSDGR